MRILDQPDQVAERVGNRGDLDALADLVRADLDRGAGALETVDRGHDIGDAPVGDRAAWPG